MLEKPAAWAEEILSYVEKVPNKEHAVVIDAGSTGSRVLAFTFHRHPLSGIAIQSRQNKRFQMWKQIEFTFFLVRPTFFRDFISSIALFKPEEGQDEKKKAKKDEKKAEKPAKKQV